MNHEAGGFVNRAVNCSHFVVLGRVKISIVVPVALL